MDASPMQIQLWIDGSWVNVDAYAEQGYKVSVGPRKDGDADPSSVEVVLANDDLELDPERPESSLYGKIGRNTMLRALWDGSTMTRAETARWEPEETIDHVPGAGLGKAMVHVQAEGVLRRLQSWVDPIDSALATQILSYGDDLLGYWPLEDPAGVTQLSQRAPRGAPGTWAGSISFGAVDGPAGSAALPSFGAGGTVSGSFARTYTTSGYQICFVTQLDAHPNSSTRLPLLGWRDSFGRMFWVNVSQDLITLDCVTSDGTLETSTDIGDGDIDLTIPTRFRVKMVPSGGNSNAEIAWYQQDDPVVWGSTVGITGSPGDPVSWFAKENAWLNGGGVGHVFATSDTSLDLTTGYAAVQAFNGYNRERAAERWYRLLGQAGFTRYVNGAMGDTPPMGRQRPGKLLDLLQECVVTCAGVMYDTQADLAVSLRTYGHLINQTPALELDYAVHLVPPLRRTTDDQGITNDVVLENLDGYRARRELTSGPMSTAPPPAGISRQVGGSDLPINYADPWRVDARAAFELNRGTVDRPRYARVVIDLAMNPSLAPALAVMRPGSWVTLAGKEPDVVTLRVVSWERSGGAVLDRVTLNCVPAEPYMVAVADAGHLVGSTSTVLTAGATSTATSLLIGTPYWRERWSVDAPDHDVLVAGERVTVTAVGAATFSSGLWRQTLTVVRSVNGVVKAQASGARVQVFGVRRVGLA